MFLFIMRILLFINLWLCITAAEPSGGRPRILEHPEDQFVAKNEPATLNCKAEGAPQPEITWFRNGRPVITANENPSSHRMLLPSGQLFFLRIINNKNNKPDVGVYYCKATNPITKESVVSRNATLEIAQLRDDFKQGPADQQVGVGDTAVLECRGPKGKPKPEIKWKKDDKDITNKNRYKVLENGNLVIREARADDSARYVCVASNIAGEKESNAARLEVMEKPKFLNSPQNVLVEEGENVEFACRATGDPNPTIIWKREDGSIPQGRSSILTDKSLKIERVKVQDEGSYICRAENSVGFVEAIARLTVHSSPSFIVTPRDKVVGVGRQVSLRCKVTGNPAPAVFWNKETSQVLMFPRQDHGRFRVSDEGTLVIDPVRKEDAGEYVCQALNAGGSAFAKAKIQVKDVDPRPPPIIHQGPQNQTLPINSICLMTCHASGDPLPKIRWLKNGKAISGSRDPRITLLDSGTLQISDLRQSDTALYVCEASSETGVTSWAASLVVEAPTNPSVIFHRTPEPSTFPGPPSKPVISEIRESSLRVTWKQNANYGASPVIAYTVEYFSHETGEGWTVATDAAKNQSAIVKNLRKGTSYMFLVRAQNSHGLSLPSQVAGPVRTRGGKKHRPDSGGGGGKSVKFNVELVSEKLTGEVVHMLDPEVLSSTAIKINWQVMKSKRYIEGYHIKYRVMPMLKHRDAHGTQGHHHHHHVSFAIETLDSSQATSYVLRNLRRWTWYEVRVQPFYLTVEGTESNTVRVRTFEDVPSAPPQRVKSLMRGNSTLQLSWAPPAKEHINGRLRGYKIFLIGNETKFHRNVTVNASTLAVSLRHLVPGMHYRIHLAAFNRMGVGVKSEPIVLGGAATGVMQGIVRETWFIATLIGTIGGTIWFALCVFSVWVWKKRRARKKLGKNGVVSVPVHNYKPDDPQRQAGGFVYSSGGDSSTGGSGVQVRTPLLGARRGDVVRTHPSGQPCAPCCTHHDTDGSHSDGSDPRNKNLSQIYQYHKIGTMQPDIMQEARKEREAQQQQENLYNNVPASMPQQQQGEWHSANGSIVTPMKTFNNRNGTNSMGPGGRMSPGCTPYATTTLVMNQYNQQLAVAQNAANAQRAHPNAAHAHGLGDSAFRPIHNGAYQEHSGGDSENSRGGSVYRGGYPGQPTAQGPAALTYGSLPDYDACEPLLRSPEFDSSGRSGAYSPPGTQPKGPGPILFLPPPPEHPPPDTDAGSPPDSPTPLRRGAVPRQCPGSPGYRRHHTNSLRTNPHLPMAGGDGLVQAHPANTPQRQLYSDGENYSAVTQPLLAHARMPDEPPHGHTMAPRTYVTDMRECYSPRAMSEPERGPTPPIRGYKLVPIHGDEPIAMETGAAQGGNHRHFSSDTEGAQPPPLRGLYTQGHDSPPSPAPRDVCQDYAAQDPTAGYRPAGDPMMDRGIQSSLPSLASEALATNGRFQDDACESEPDDGRLSPDSSVGGDIDQNSVAAGSMLASWASVTDGSECSSVHSSSSDGEFLAQADFASAVAKAAELSGLTVVGSTVIDPNSGKERVKKQRPVKERPKRPTSPYSTDSNYSSVQMPHKPYPKSERRKQMRANGSSQNGGSGNSSSVAPPSGQSDTAGSATPQQQKQRPPVREKPVMQNGDLKKLNTSSASDPQGQGEMRTIANPLAAFDTTDTPIV